MTTAVLVHGTGVRGEKYSRLFRVFAEGMRRHAPSVAVIPFGWGEFLGTELAFGGASIPGYGDAAPAKVREEPDTLGLTAARWVLLEADPLHDLRFLADGSGDDSLGTWLSGNAAYGAEISERLAKLPGDGILAAELAGADLLDVFEVVVAEVAASPVTRAAVTRTRTVAAQRIFVAALAEAVVGAMGRHVLLTEGAVLPVSGDTRERWVMLLIDEMGGSQLGLLDPLKTLSLRLVGSVSTWAFDRWRRPLSDRAQPGVGDIVHYLVRGERLRDAIAARISSIDDDVVLIGHSLGGIACLDLLLMRSVPSVRSLVTVGSQGPLLLELDALPGLKAHAPVPPSLPPWLNVYDERDVLSYLAEPIFGPSASDVRVDTGCAMPQAHGAYFDKDEFYQAILTHLRRVAGEQGRF